jgi:hypothetical protein
MNLTCLLFFFFKKEESYFARVWANMIYRFFDAITICLSVSEMERESAWHMF